MAAGSLGIWGLRGLLLILLLVACAVDSRQRRIPNWVSLTGSGAAVAWHGLAPPGQGLFSASSAGGLGWWSGVGGALAAFGFFFLFYLLRTAGAGDAKLMGMLGAFFGLDSVPALILAVLVSGGVLAVARALVRRRVRSVLANLRLVLVGIASRLAGQPGPRFDPAADTADRLPYAWALAAGAVGLSLVQYLA